MFCHLGGLAFVLVIPFANVIAPLIFWLIQKDKHPFVDREGKEALNFQISISIYAVACGLLVFAVIGLFLLPALMVFNVVMIILAAVKANNGEHFHYPLTIRFIYSLSDL
ncbi:MAG TPA: DUF4870 domain-containing protein [Phycisphaerae bacterium]|nr:DUF4870 domain-containing protein [Phycisphaerae bacterium]